MRAAKALHSLRSAAAVAVVSSLTVIYGRMEALSARLKCSWRGAPQPQLIAGLAGDHFVCFATCIPDGSPLMPGSQSHASVVCVTWKYLHAPESPQLHSEAPPLIALLLVILSLATTESLAAVRPRRFVVAGSCIIHSRSSFYPTSTCNVWPAGNCGPAGRGFKTA